MTRAAVFFLVVSALLPSLAAAGVEVQALGGLQAPLSPLGQDSFATDHRPGPGGWGRALWRSGDWGWGLEGMDGAFQRLDQAGSVSWWQAGVVAAWGFSMDEVAQDRLALSLGLGMAGIDAGAPLIQRAWTAPAGSLGLTYALPLGSQVDLLFGASAWGVLGPGGFDPLAAGSVGLGLGWTTSRAKEGNP